MDEESIEEIKQTPLEYRPNLKRSEREKMGWEASVSSEESYPIVEDESSIGEGSATEIIKDYKETKDKVEEEIERLEDLLEKETIPFPPEYKEDVDKAKEELELGGGNLTIKDYKEALMKSDTAAGAFLLDIIEIYIEDMEGSIEWEIYGEYVEIQLELTLMDKYIQKLIYPVFQFEEKEEDWEEALAAQEGQWGEKKENSQKEKASKEKDYRSALLFEPSLIPQTRGNLHEVEEISDKILHEHELLFNSLQTVSGKTEEVQLMLGFGEFLLEEELEEEILTDLFLLTESETEEDERLVNIQNMLQLSADQSIKKKGQFKNILRNTYSIPKREKQVEELAVYEKAYTKETLPLLHHMRGLQKNVPEQTSSFLNHLARGMQENQAQRDNLLYEVYLLNKATSEIRNQKFHLIAEKEQARKSYQKINEEQIQRKENA